MGAFIARQPNGLLCRFSTVVDTVTHYNMTFEDYVVDVQMGKYGRSRKYAEMEAKDTIEHYIRPFQEVIDRFVPTNQTKKQFQTILKDMGYK
ncbi:MULTISPECIES: hypothetical protein [Bacteroidaceae]|uniref:hypothetical protein n=1 Tax=Bacteroidaceae TaxID=815 RepID=UPI0035626665